MSSNLEITAKYAGRKKRSRFMKRPATWKVVTVGIALGFGVIGAGTAMAKPTDAARESAVAVDASTAMAKPADVLRVSADNAGPPEILRDSADNAGPPEILRERAAMPGRDILRGLPGV
jgi:hypothetical protein